ncbi:MAG: right-handed parallel beta-helix repeat-containing protein [Thermoplasmatales archaeon]|nr:MAG: right-handed parallel beta-helix repeat-containing protein [Thermoplasmatales archaeon]
MKYIITIMVILLLLSSSFVGVSNSIEKSSTVFFDGKTLYVGGDGPGNYSKIQDAINDANDGDTVFVYDDSSPYQEDMLQIEKSINLIGENRDTTVISGIIDFIDCSPYTDVIIFITTDWVNISGFTIQNSERCGITVYMGDNINISGNIFIDNGLSSIGILISNYSCISDNIFTGNVVDNLFCTGGGIFLEHASFTNIIGNIFTNCSGGIGLSSLLELPMTSRSNIISGNFFDKNDVAMEIRADNTLISKNTISNHNRPLNLIIPALKLEGRNNTVSCNNFINNIRNANDVFYIFSLRDIFKIRKYGNVWDGNYWGKPRPLPKIIFGYFRFERSPPNPAIPILFFNVDWHPAREPYDIGV